MSSKYRLFVLCVFMISGLQFVFCGSEIPKDKPNVIYILADDLGYGDLSCYGQKKFETPNIDELAREGMKFTNHYAGSTVCAPSRSALLTGQHTGNTPVRGNKPHHPEGQWPLPEEANSLARLFKQSGYVTGAFGKWGLGYPNSSGDPLAMGFDEFFGYNCQRNAHHYYPWHLYHNNQKVILEENAETRRGQYAPDLIHQEAMQFLEDHNDQKFFMYYPSVIPHAELLAPEEYMKKFRGKFLPESSYEGAGPEHPRFRKGPYGSQPEAHAAFAAMITLLDDQVGEIVEKLKELGISENTIIVFTSDNGPHEEGGADPEFFNSNGPLRGFKRDLYEGGIRVPMIARWPGQIEAGAESDHISAFWDMLPTFADLLGVKAPENTDGISMLPELTGEGSQKEHAYLYWEFHELGGRQAVRMGKWKGVKYNVKKHPDQAIELYNLENDPGETHDVAAKHPEVVDRIDNVLKTASTESSVFKF
ncbi:arylsulfatase [Marinilabilia rubra]|uniref:Arylsulfatase n=1 Tax=Marinilabilia rubra TaxID=2162893 RepID=A0A2U2B7D0_9BACT|nr:arylsulfatase [Marinilabilia rubra]PWD98980.1 arylsulfatase [Marinilabilia rubra]